MRLYAVRSLSLQTSARIIVRVMCRCSFPRKGPWRKRADSSRRAGEERASSPPAKQRPIETSFLRIPSRHQDRRAREGAGNFSEM